MSSAEPRKKGKPRGRPFQSGAPSANPGGRPKKNRDLAAKCRAFDDELVERLHAIATSGAGEDKDAVAAVKLLWAYGHGNPASKLDVSSDGKPLGFGVVMLPGKVSE